MDPNAPLLEPESTAVGTPNVPGAPPVHRPWYASPWMLLGLLALFLLIVTWMSRGLHPEDDPRAAHPDSAAVHR